MRRRRLLGALAAATALGEDSLPATETWVVAVSTSRYWANYRHEVNALAVYNAAKRFGVNEKAVLMVAEPCACNAKNPFRGELYVGDRLLMAPAREAYAREHATPQNLKNLLTGRTPGLDSGPRSNVLLYLTGHGGDGFLKFHDADEINSFEIAAAIREMRLKRRYRRMLFVVDTCQAASLFRELTDETLGVLGVASSRVGENAYATHPHPIIAVSLADRFTRALDSYFREDACGFDDVACIARHWLHRGRPTARNSLGAFVDDLSKAPTRSTLTVHDASWGSSLEEDWRSVPLTDFFGDPASSRQRRLRSYYGGGKKQNNASGVASFPDGGGDDSEEDDVLAVFGSLSPVASSVTTRF